MYKNDNDNNGFNGVDAFKFIKSFYEVGIDDVDEVGGKNAALGELFSQLHEQGINVPWGFATTAEAYHNFIEKNRLAEPLTSLLSRLDRKDFSNLPYIGNEIRELMKKAHLPDQLEDELTLVYEHLCDIVELENTSVAVRSSATAEDLPEASFAGLHDSFLNIQGVENLIKACKQCYISLFNDRAIKYREDKGFDHMDIAISVGIQLMVRSDKGCAGVGFTLDPESGFNNVIIIDGSWGLGENIVQGKVTPDEFCIFKETFGRVKNPVLYKKLGDKLLTRVYADNADHDVESTTVNIDTPAAKQQQFVLHDDEILQLAEWCLKIEKHFGRPMDIEWAKDGLTNELYILQARPETIHSLKDPYKLTEYNLLQQGVLLVQGNGVGSKIAAGIARILNSPDEAAQLQQGEVLVTDITNPDWDPIMKKAAAIITNKGGRTSHASIIAREMGLAAVVGAANATEKIKTGQKITISCAEGKAGKVYNGILKWQEKNIDFRKINKPKTKPLLILGDPDQAFRLSFYPAEGIGLLRLEFIISNSIKVHPLALIKFNELKDAGVKAEIERITLGYADKKQYFIEKMAQAVGTIAAAFYPKEVIVRMSDFKSNEYANLVGGRQFEPVEENPMLGFRGASRYYNEHYKEGFELECAAMKVVRNDMGLTNVKLMIPFCRTVEEGKKVIEILAENGLKRGENGLQIYMMTEIPSNVLLAEQFAKIFDGFSIGSNDLTQLTLGIDRDSEIISNLFDEKNAAPKQLISTVIKKAKKAGIKIGLCGQAPSDFPEFAQFLVQEGIDSISFNPDALIHGIENILNAEEKLKKTEIINEEDEIC